MARSLHVLLVDDDADLRDALARGLASSGFEVTTAGTAAEAIAAAEDPEVSIDVIVMDILLPDSWGAQAALAQASFRPDAKVVYISGEGRSDAVLQASSAAADAPFLSKPFALEELTELIHRVATPPT